MRPTREILLRSSFRSICRAMVKCNVAGALTTEEQLLLTKCFARMAKLLNVHVPNMTKGGNND